MPESAGCRALILMLLVVLAPALAPFVVIWLFFRWLLNKGDKN